MDKLDTLIEALLEEYDLKDILEASDLTEASALRLLCELELVTLPELGMN